jgi:hypothetical protein
MQDIRVVNSDLKRLVTRLKVLSNPRALISKVHADRGRERYRRAGITASTAFLSKALTIIISFASVPLTVHYLGPERRSNRLIQASTTPRTISSLRPSIQAANPGGGLTESIANCNRSIITGQPRFHGRGVSGAIAGPSPVPIIPRMPREHRIASDPRMVRESLRGFQSSIRSDESLLQQPQYPTGSLKQSGSGGIC